jgi:hypothetical protein
MALYIEILGAVCLTGMVAFLLGALAIVLHNAWKVLR